MSATGGRHPPTHQNMFADMSARLADISATTQNSKEGKHLIHFMKGILVPTRTLGLANLLMFESRLKSMVEDVNVYSIQGEKIKSYLVHNTQVQGSEQTTLRNSCIFLCP
jgi:hypothetical protein